MLQSDHGFEEFFAALIHSSVIQTHIFPELWPDMIIRYQAVHEYKHSNLLG